MVLTDEQHNYILELNELTHKSPSYAVEKFKEKYNIRITEETIRKRWKESGLELQSQGGYRTKSRKSYNHSPLYHLINNPNAKYLRFKGRHV